MKSYVINLDRCADRLQDIVEVFKHNNLDFVRVRAVDGKEYAKTLRNWSYLITPPEVGCFYSHIRCFELIAAGDEDYAAIFEDDIILSKSASHFLSSIEWIPGDADIIKIETKDEKKKIKLDEVVNLTDFDFKIGKLKSIHLGTAGYIISKKAASNIINILKKPEIPIDNYLFSGCEGELSNFCVYQIFPALCKQKTDGSIIDVERSEWHSMEVEERRRNKIQIGIGERIIREIKRPLRKYSNRFLNWYFEIHSTHRVGKGWRCIPFENHRV